MTNDIDRLKEAREFPQFPIATVSEITGNCTKEIDLFKDYGTKYIILKTLKIDG